MTSERPTLSVQTKVVLVLIILVIAGFAFYEFRDVIAPLVLAVILAYVLTPLVNNLQRRMRLPRPLVTLLVYLVMLSIIVGLFMILVPTAMRQAWRFNHGAQNLWNRVHAFTQGSLVVGEITISGEDIFLQASNALQTLFQPLLGTTFGVLKGILSSVAWVVFIFVVSFYMIIDSQKIASWLETLPPPAERSDFIRLRSEISTIWSAFFRGQLLLSIVVMGLITAECFAIGMPYPLFMGILAGLMEFFPGIGHSVWFTVASLVALFAGSTWLPVPNWVFWLLLCGCQLIFTQFDLNYLIPRIIGRSVHLSPLVVVLGILAGASLAGVLGVVLAAPTIASLRVLIRYLYARLLDMDPFPESPISEPLPPPSLNWWQTSGKTQRRWKNGWSKILPFRRRKQSE
jgi:predicted PurR-regulated permease PerM